CPGQVIRPATYGSKPAKRLSLPHSSDSTTRRVTGHCRRKQSWTACQIHSQSDAVAAASSTSASPPGSRESRSDPAPFEEGRLLCCLVSHERKALAKPGSLATRTNRFLTMTSANSSKLIIP